MSRSLSWFGVMRLGFVQMALGAVVVIAVSTLNRIMVVELALPAILPGLLVALHYAVQALRPRWGYGSDGGRRITPWIVGGIALLAIGGFGAANATVLMATNLTLGIVCAVAAYAAIGIGAGAAGTSNLVLLAKSVAPARRPAAAALVWIMMIAGFALTAGIGGRFLDPFSGERLIAVSGIVSCIAFVVAALAVWGLECPVGEVEIARRAKPPFLDALREVWGEVEARRFTIFIFVSMLAYGGQELILEPFAGAVFGLTPGQTTALTGLHHGGVLLGMILGAALGTVTGAARSGHVRGWIAGGCIASAIALFGLASASFTNAGFPLQTAVALLGMANGAYAVAAIGSMMALATSGTASREGVRMGLWGASQGIAFGLGGVVSTTLADTARLAFGSPVAAYGIVFAVEAALFLVSATLALGLTTSTERRSRPQAFKVTPETMPQEAGAR